MGTVKTGIERFVENPTRWVSRERLGLLCNPASVTADFIHSRIRIANVLPNRLAALYSPQHGFFAEKQDNMIESADMTDPVLGIPVFSLYGETRVPTRKMMEPIDILLVDLQDAGTRVYTFISTIANCMAAAKEMGKKVLIMDRPNPVGGNAVEGNCLQPDCESFVGRHGIPMRHGLTLGELALYYNRYFDIGCDLTVVPMAGWQRDMYFADTGLPWVPPSPNLPTPVSAVVYPGQVLWEGTNISEGRGTTQPFELFGAPFLEIEAVLDALEPAVLSGMHLRPVCFEPTSNKWAGVSCNGFQIHITDRGAYRPYRLTLRLIQAIIHQYPEAFQWKPPPYEYEHHRMPIDLILGDVTIRKKLEKQHDIAEMETEWQEDINAFQMRCRDIRLY